jgi:hypothetical protein
MKFKKSILIASLFYSVTQTSIASVIPTISIADASSNNVPSVKVIIKNSKNINNLKFNGLDKNFSITGREVEFKSSSHKSDMNQFETKIFLEPIKPGKFNISASANLDNKMTNSNTIELNISKNQINKYNENKKKTLANENKKIKQINVDIMNQIKLQQKFFDNLNHMMQKQENEMLKQQQEMIKSLND